MSKRIEDAITYITDSDRRVEAKNQMDRELQRQVGNLHRRTLSILEDLTPTDPEIANPIYDPYPRRVTSPVSYGELGGEFKFRLRERVRMVEKSLGNPGLTPQTSGVFIDQLDPISGLFQRQLFLLTTTSATNWHGRKLTPDPNGFQEILVAESIVDYIDQNLYRASQAATTAN